MKFPMLKMKLFVSVFALIVLAVNVIAADEMKMDSHMEDSTVAPPLLMQEGNYSFSIESK